MQWTEENIEDLTLGVELGLSHAEIAETLGRSVQAVKSKATKLKVSHRVLWTEKDLAFIEEAAIFGLSFIEISKELGRSLDSVKHKARKLNISTSRLWLEKEEAFLRKWYPRKGAAYCCTYLDRSPGTIMKRASMLNLYSPQGLADVDCYTYFMQFSKDLYKVGISTNPEQRLKSLAESGCIMYSTRFTERHEARALEQDVLEFLGLYKKNTGRLASGNTETFIIPPKDKSLLIVKKLFNKEKLW